MLTTNKDSSAVPKLSNRPQQHQWALILCAVSGEWAVDFKRKGTSVGHSKKEEELSLAVFSTLIVVCDDDELIDDGAHCWSSADNCLPLVLWYLLLECWQMMLKINANVDQQYWYWWLDRFVQMQQQQCQPMMFLMTNSPEYQCLPSKNTAGQHLGQKDGYTHLQCTNWVAVNTHSYSPHASW